MPVYRFRTIEEMNGFSPPGPAGSLDDRVIAALNLGRVLSGHRFPPGIHRSRSIEEHALLRERWEAESGRSLHGPEHSLSGASDRAAPG
jgi:hypothetical protein